MYLFQSTTLTFKNGFFLNDTPIHCRLCPHKLHVCKTFDGGESTPVIAETLGGKI